MNKFKKIILCNNIPLYLCVDPHMKNTYVSYNVLYGSSGLWFKFNNDGKDYEVFSGYAHYLEHLLGEHCKFGNMYDNFQRRLQDANAYTSYDVTSYHFRGLYDVEKSIEELIISMECPVFDKKDVEATRHAIEEEAASYCDNPGVMLVDMVERNLYGGFELFDETLSPIGNRETTRLITIDDLYNCYNAFYTDNNKYIVIAGNVDENRIVELLNNIYSKISQHKSSLILPDIDFKGIRKQDDVIYRDIDTPISSIGVKVKRPDGVSMKLFDYCISAYTDHLLNSKQYNDLNKQGVYDSFEYGFNRNTGDYIDFIQSFTTKDKAECFGRLMELLTKKDINEKEYDLVKKAIIAAEIRSMDDKYEHVEDFPQKFYYSDSYYDSDYYRTIGYDEFMEVLSSLDFSSYTTGEVRQLKRKSQQ